MAQHIPACAAGVVAVSGGPDSTALAYVLTALRSEGAVGPLTLAHVNHQLRGNESDGDEAFVADLAKKLAVGSRFCRLAVADVAAERGDNLESTARRLRYDWLADVARSIGAAWVATGHTADDQAETVLHRLLRGSGLQGLRGIPAFRGLAPGVDVIRPMLQVSRVDVMAYLADHQVTARQDSTNVMLHFTRNRIRHDLLPKLIAEYNPALVSILSRLAEQADEAQSFIVEQAKRLLQECELTRAGDMLIFQAMRLQNAHRHVVREMFRLAWQREGWPASGMTFADWTRLSDLASLDETTINLAGNVMARRCGTVIQLCHCARFRE